MRAFVCVGVREREREKGGGGRFAMCGLSERRCVCMCVRMFACVCGIVTGKLAFDAIKF